MPHINNHFTNVSLASAATCPSGIQQHLSAVALPFAHSLTTTNVNNNNNMNGSTTILPNGILAQMPMVAIAASSMTQTTESNNNSDTTNNSRLRNRSTNSANDSMFKCSYCPRKLTDQESVFIYTSYTICRLPSSAPLLLGTDSTYCNVF